LENKKDIEEINRAWENKENIKTSAEEFLRPLCTEASKVMVG